MKKKRFIEVYAKNKIEKYFSFNNLIVGDKPDIHSTDDKIGFEVVTLELELDYMYESYWNSIIKNNYDVLFAVKERTLIENKLKNSHRFLFYRGEESGGELHLFHLEIVNNKVDHVYIKDKHRTRGYDNQIFEQRLRNKLKKLNNGSYGRVQSKYLCVVSISRYKGISNAKEYTKLFELHNQHSFFKQLFDGLFLVFSTEAYFFDSISKDLRIESYAADDRVIAETHNEILSGE